MSNSAKTVLVAMSGGVDSSVAAYLLKEQGFQLIGITMKTWGYDDIPQKDTGCCSLETIYSARNVAHQLGFNHYTLDLTDKFNETVISDFVDEYMKGRTPNPCVLCNKTIKWGALLEKGASLGADLIATGHYARVKFDPPSGRYFISAASDEDKDQSYALWRLSQQSLSKTVFPLGSHTKTEVRSIASRLGLKPAETPDSQEICFVPDNNYRELLKIRVPGLDSKPGAGDIMLRSKKIGTHKGYFNYTVGQRRGLNISVGKPVYVTRIDADNNIVHVDYDEGTYNTTLIAKEVNLLKYKKLDSAFNAKVKIRYKDKGDPAVLEPIDDQHVKVTFDSPKRSIAPGQSAVFYEGDDVIGGGIIDRIMNSEL